MSINFPLSPTLEQIYTFAGRSWKWDGRAWRTVNFVEGYTGYTGSAGAGGATGGGSDQVFYENGQTITTSYTIPLGKSAMTTGPVSVSSGTVVTVSNGSRWVIL